jgi:zinc D-Ala-D-Ala dipeptidase
MLSAAGFAQSAVPAEPTGAQQGFRIAPLRPIAELRAEALKAKPPEEQGQFERLPLVELIKIDPSIHLDIRYATSNNFLGQPVYEQARAFLRWTVAYRLKRVSAALRQKGYGLLVYDAYRPWYVTKILWEATPVDKREFVADPAQGSFHNRGCAVDLTIYDLKSGEPVAMPSGYDEMTPRAYANFAGGTPEEREHRAILREAMEGEGFVQMPNEWWHYDYQNWQQYRILNVPFDRLYAR